MVLQMESCAVSTAMLDDISAQEASCKAAVERAQDKLKRLNLDAEVAKHQAALDDLQRRASALRQVSTACIQTLLKPVTTHASKENTYVYVHVYVYVYVYICVYVCVCICV